MGENADFTFSPGQVLIMFRSKWLVRIMVYLMIAAMLSSVFFYALEAFMS